jgi:hypothetical protein
MAKCAQYIWCAEWTTRSLFGEPFRDEADSVTVLWEKLAVRSEWKATELSWLSEAANREEEVGLIAKPTVRRAGLEKGYPWSNT